MEIKENTKRNGKTNRRNPFKHKAFHEIISWDQQYSIPKEIQWEIEKSLDSGIFKLAQHFDKVISDNFEMKINVKKFKMIAYIALFCEFRLLVFSAL